MIKEKNKKQVSLVVHIIYRLDYGGLENGLVNIINNLPVDRYRHAIICLTTYSDFRKRIKRDDIEVYALNKKEGKDIGCYWRLWKLLRKLSPEIVHTRNLSTQDSCIVAMLAGVPIRIHGEHGRDTYDLDGSNWKYNILRRFCRLFIHRYVPMSKDLATWLCETVGVPKSKIVHIYNGVDSKRFHPPKSERESLPKKNFADKEDIVVGFVGRMEKVKDPLMLVRAFIFLQEAASDEAKKLKLVLVGDGTLHNEIERLLESGKIEERAWLAGARDDIDKLYRCFDIFVLPSIAEGISNTILEAMASGLPVVATEVGGSPELVKNKHNGMLVRASYPAETAEVLLQYVRHPELIEQHGKAARERAEKEFSLQSMVNQYLALYDTMTAQLGKRN